MRPRRGLLIALFVAVAASACGGKSADQVLADRAVLRSSDFPSTGDSGLGWDRTGISGDELATTVIGKCAKFDSPGLVVTARAHSDWVSGAWLVTSFSAVYEGLADQAFARLSGHAVRCVRAARASGGKANVREIALPPIGESRRGYRIQSASGGFAVDEVVVVVQRGRTLALLWFDDVDTRVLVELAEAVASRL